MELRIKEQKQKDRDQELSQYIGKPIEYLETFKIKSLKTIMVMPNKECVQNTDGTINEEKLIDLYRTFKYLNFNGNLRTMMFTSVNHRPLSLWSMLKKCKDKLVLNFGSGVGTHTIFAIENGAKVEALEVWGPITKFANWRLELRNFKCLNLAHNYILPREKYDAAVCVEVLEHVVNPTKLFKMITESLKKGAMLSLRVSKVIKDTSGHLSENIHNWQTKGIPILNAEYKQIEPELFEKV